MWFPPNIRNTVYFATAIVLSYLSNSYLCHPTCPSLHRCKKIVFLVSKCCRLTWGLPRKALLVLYKSIFLPKILYCCSIWGSSVKFKWCSKMLRSAQGPLSFVIEKAFKSTSTFPSLVLANILPLVQSRIGYRARTHGTDNLTPSANVLIKKVVEAAIANVAPDIPNRTKEVKNQMRVHFHRVWDSEWKSCRRRNNLSLLPVSIPARSFNYPPTIHKGLSSPHRTLLLKLLPIKNKVCGLTVMQM